MMKYILFLFLLFFQQARAQLFPQPAYPQGYFRNPLGIPIQLSANFGELRTNHYHMGFDIRTNQRENLPVYAAAEGYISRVKIERYGYGRAIYITHPNGYTTLYAHLNDFYQSLHAYVKNKQYNEEQWEQDITFSPGQFPVQKGQFIAYSGNTGGSAGPHLHFEIRDSKTENNLNPWLFDFGLADKIPPFIYRLYYYDRRYSTYQSGPSQVRIKRAGNGYTTYDNVVVLPTPSISFGISAEDKSNTSPFLFGIYQAELYVDDTARFAFRLNDISYYDSRTVNGAIDYLTRWSGGPYIQHLSRLPGNNSTIFSPATSGDGVIIMADTLVHQARIEVKDPEGNTSILQFRFRYDPSLLEEKAFTDNSIPMMPNQENNLALEDIEVVFPPYSFYHMVPFVHMASEARHIAAASPLHALHHYRVPVHDSFTLKIRSAIPAGDPLRDKIVMQLTSEKKVVTTKGEWQGDWMVAKFWDLGNALLVVDTVPPSIQLRGWKNNSNVGKRKSIALHVKDNAGEIKRFRAELDGKWLMFRRQDYLFIHDFDDKTSRGLHSLRVVVEDEAGNVTEKIYAFRR